MSIKYFKYMSHERDEIRGRFSEYMARPVSGRIDSERFLSNIPDTPFMAKLRMSYYNSEKGHYEIDHCGASVIDSQWLVTAAHCVAADPKLLSVRVSIGDVDLNSYAMQDYIVDRFYFHSGFRYETLENDIALIHLSSPLPDSITPAVLPEKDAPLLPIGTEVFSVGWPVTGPAAGDKLLNITPLKVNLDNREAFTDVSSKTGEVEGPCQGESGGPLLAIGENGIPTVMGVLSGIKPEYGRYKNKPCHQEDNEKYYTPIATFRDWIDDTLENDGAVTFPANQATHVVLATPPRSKPESIKALAASFREESAGDKTPYGVKDFSHEYEKSREATEESLAPLTTPLPKSKPILTAREL